MVYFSFVKDEHVTAKDVIRIIRQSEDNYQVKEILSTMNDLVTLSVYFSFLASRQRKLSSYVGLDIQSSTTSTAHNESKN
jgi:hypothetical protein